MQKYLCPFLLVIIISIPGFSQVVNTGLIDTTSHIFSGKLKISGYVDTYYCYDFNKPTDGNRAYFYSMNRHNEVNINLAYIDLRYSSSTIRARFMPGFGTYINSNYASEQGTLKNIVEASVGVRISKKRDIWLDGGVFGSPYTNETAISKDHLAYTRSFAPENVPYYLSGAKLTVPLSKKVNTYLYILNGWQQINDQNKNKAIATQFEYRPTDFLLINWDTYIGNESSASDQTIGTRYFSDLYFIYKKGKWSATSCMYVGRQEQANGNAFWWQVNLIGRYSFTEKLSLTARVEYFEDVHSVMIVPITDVQGFDSYSGTLGLNFKVTDNALLRLEGRTFYSNKDVYLRNDVAVNNSNMITTNITIWF